MLLRDNVGKPIPSTSRFALAQLHLLHSTTTVAVVDPDPALASGVHPQHALPVLLLPHLQRGPLRCGDDDHGLGGLFLVLVHGLVDLIQVIVGDVVVLPHLLIVQKLFADLRVQLLNLGVQTLLLLVHPIESTFQLADLPLDFGVLSAADPLDRVLLCFFNIANSFENVGNIVDASLLDLQDLHRHVEIDGHVGAILDELDELLGQDGKTVILPSATAFLVSLAVDAEVVVLFIVVQEVLLYLGGGFLGDSFSHASDNIIQESKLLFSRSFTRKLKLKLESNGEEKWEVGLVERIWYLVLRCAFRAYMQSLLARINHAGRQFESI